MTYGYEPNDECCAIATISLLTHSVNSLIYCSDFFFILSLWNCFAVIEWLWQSVQCAYKITFWELRTQIWFCLVSPILTHCDVCVFFRFSADSFESAVQNHCFFSHFLSVNKPCLPEVASLNMCSHGDKQLFRIYLCKKRDSCKWVKVTIWMSKYISIEFQPFPRTFVHSVVHYMVSWSRIWKRKHHINCVQLFSEIKTFKQQTTYRVDGRQEMGFWESTYVKCAHFQKDHSHAPRTHIRYQHSLYGIGPGRATWLGLVWFSLQRWPHFSFEPKKLNDELFYLYQKCDACSFIILVCVRSNAIYRNFSHCYMNIAWTGSGLNGMHAYNVQ